MNYAIYLPTGEITKIVQTSADRIHLYLAQNEEFIEADATLADLVDVATKTLVKNGKGQPPSPAAAWDGQQEKWVENLDVLKALKKTAIEAERDARMSAPIVYNGATFDADAASLDRLTKKVATVQIMMDNKVTPDAATLVWHDATNANHTFATLADYQAFLQGLALALDQRAMAAWGWSWVRKGELTAATTATQVNAITW